MVDADFWEERSCMIPHEPSDFVLLQFPVNLDMKRELTRTHKLKFQRWSRTAQCPVLTDHLRHLRGIIPQIQLQNSIKILELRAWRFSNKMIELWRTAFNWIQYKTLSTDESAVISGMRDHFDKFRIILPFKCRRNFHNYSSLKRTRISLASKAINWRSHIKKSRYKWLVYY